MEKNSILISFQFKYYEEGGPSVVRAVTTIFILGGLEVTIGGGLTMVGAEELKNLF